MPEDRKLYNKYQVRDAVGNPLDSGTFVLRPFNADGTVRDPLAVEALAALSNRCESEGFSELAEGLKGWLANPESDHATKTLNVPAIDLNS